MRMRLLVVISVALALGAPLVPAANASTATLMVSPPAGPPTSTVGASGSGFGANETVTLAFDGATVGSATTGGGGGFSTTFVVPKSALPGPHVVQATGGSSGTAAQAAFTVRTDWTRFRFNNQRTGVQPFENVLNRANVPFMQLDWLAQLGQLVYGSSPAVVKGVVYIGSFDGRLWAYPADGCGSSLCTTPLWTSTSLAQIVDSPTVVNGLVYVGSQTSASSNDGKLDVFAAAGCPQHTCPPLWQGVAGPQSILDSSPAVAGGSVYVGSYDGKLYVFNANGCGQPTCQPLWTAQTGGHIESTPTVVGAAVYIGSDDGNLYAFPAAGCGSTSCAPRWKGPIGGPAFSSSPAVANGVVYIGSDHYLTAFDAAGCGAAICQPLWQGAHQPDFTNGSPAVFNGHVYIGLENGVGVFAAGGCGQALCGPAWTLFGSGSQAAVISSPTIANGVVYAGRNTKQVLAWRAASCGHFSCSEIWSGFTNDPIVNSSPTVVNGKLYIGSADDLFPENIQGRLYVFDLPGGP